VPVLVSAVMMRVRRMTLLAVGNVQPVVVMLLRR
jgi:hypothetical protein